MLYNDRTSSSKTSAYAAQVTVVVEEEAVVVEDSVVAAEAVVVVEPAIEASVTETTVPPIAAETGEGVEPSGPPTCAEREGVPGGSRPVSGGTGGNKVQTVALEMDITCGGSRPMSGRTGWEQSLNCSVRNGYNLWRI